MGRWMNVDGRVDRWLGRHPGDRRVETTCKSPELVSAGGRGPSLAQGHLHSSRVLRSARSAVPLGPQLPHTLPSQPHCGLPLPGPTQPLIVSSL